MNNKTKADLIRDKVTIPDLLNAYGIAQGRRGRIACPIHRGHNQSSFSYNATQYQCFNCGAKGGVISFVEAYLECDFERAMDEINRLFRLWDEEDPAKRESIADRLRRKSRRQAQDTQRAQKEREKEKKEALLLEVHRLIANKIKYAPKSESDEWHPLYIEALKNLEIAQYKVDCL